MTKIAIKVAASTLVLGLTMVSCRSDTAVIRTASASAASADSQAAAAHAEARRALQRGDLAGALTQIETAVSLSPRDVGYRLLLADIYLKNGRFESARATYGDVIEIDPENVRAGLHYALTQIALGRPQGAVPHLDRIAGRAPVADVGLAYALAGMPERGIELLEPAARSLTASPRLRQNLALAYAMAGNWDRARAVAAQDVSPADVASRLSQWATLARPDAAGSQVASLLGVTPVADPGQPVHLALHAAPEPVAETAFAAAEPQAEPEPEPETPFYEFTPVQYAGIPVAPPEAPAPVEFDLSEPAPAVAAEAPAAEPEPTPVQLRYAAAAESLTRAEPAIVRAPAIEAAPPPPVFRRAPAAPARGEAEPRERRVASAAASRYVVQIGAFSTPENAERAWVQAERRFGLRSEQPLTTTIDMEGRVLHRVSLAGFDSRGHANRMCGSIKARGGECFVRETAGDAPVRWAARYARTA